MFCFHFNVFVTPQKTATLPEVNLVTDDGDNLVTDDGDNLQVQ